MPYRGTAVNGMLLWLDENLLKKWCKLSDAKIDPQPGGMFYLTLRGKHIREDWTVFGVIEIIDTEANSFKVTKLMCVLDENKLDGLEMSVSFSEEQNKCSAIKLRVSHTFDPNSKDSFDKAVANNWPTTFTLFKEFIEN
jgi:hypothetical protein